MTDEPDWPPDPSKFPAYAEAFRFVQPSYDIAARRMDSAAARIQALSTVISAVTFGAFALAAQAIGHPDFWSRWVAAALVASVFALFVGWVALHRWNILMTVDPKKVYDKGQSEDPAVFELQALFFAGQHFETNQHR